MRFQQQQELYQGKKKLDLVYPDVVFAQFLLESNNGEYPLEYGYNSPRPFVQNMQFDEVYQLAADMGGAGYIFTGEHDADVMHNSAIINLNVAKEAVLRKLELLISV